MLVGVRKDDAAGGHAWQGSEDTRWGKEVGRGGLLAGVRKDDKAGKMIKLAALR